MSQKRIPKEFQAIIHDALAQGLVTIEKGSRHLSLRRADGHKQMIPGSPSDHRALVNFKHQFRKFVEGVPNRRELRRHAEKSCP